MSVALKLKAIEIATFIAVNWLVKKLFTGMFASKSNNLEEEVVIILIICIGKNRIPLPT